jgi:hypothetical protein
LVGAGRESLVNYAQDEAELAMVDADDEQGRRAICSRLPIPL